MPDISLDDLVAKLGAELTPVRRLPSPSMRAAGWIGLVAVMAVVLAQFCDLPALERRLTVAPDMWLGVVGSTTTAALAAWAALELSVPGSRRRWALLPLPALALWMSASGLGCLRTWAFPHPQGLDPAGEAQHCFVHIVAMSVPLMAAMLVLVRRACPMRPNLTTLVAGLAVAAASASLLNFVHPYDASASDLLGHLVAVLVVIGVNQALGSRKPKRHAAG